MKKTSSDGGYLMTYEQWDKLKEAVRGEKARRKKEYQLLQSARRTGDEKKEK